MPSQKADKRPTAFSRVLTHCTMMDFFCRHASCESGQLDVVKFLLNQPGVNVNVKDKKNNTPLTGLKSDISTSLIFTKTALPF